MNERWKPKHGDSFWAISWDMESVSNIINVGDDVEPPEPAIMTLNEWTTASELLNNGYTINNEPCGVFEHRNDAGEREE